MQVVHRPCSTPLALAVRWVLVSLGSKPGSNPRCFVWLEHAYLSLEVLQA